MRHEEAMADHLFRWVPIVFVPKTVRTAEVGNAAFRGNAGASEEYDFVAGKNALLQFLLQLGLPSVKHIRLDSRPDYPMPLLSRMFRVSEVSGWGSDKVAGCHRGALACEQYKKTRLKQPGLSRFWLPG